MDYLLAGLALALTILIEGLVAALFLGRWQWIEASLIQAVTWPPATILIGRTGFLWPVEAGVACAEVLLWMFVLPISARKAFGVSFAANGLTALIGWTLFAFF